MILAPRPSRRDKHPVALLLQPDVVGASWWRRQDDSHGGNAMRRRVFLGPYSCSECCRCIMVSWPCQVNLAHGSWTRLGVNVPWMPRSWPIFPRHPKKSGCQRPRHPAGGCFWGSYEPGNLVSGCAIRCGYVGFPLGFTCAIVKPRCLCTVFADEFRLFRDARGFTVLTEAW